MGFRFRKSIKLFPGVRVNVSKSGVSTSIGVPGATINIGQHGVRGTVGLPGTGISYSERLDGPNSARSANNAPPSRPVVSRAVLLLALLGVVIFLALTVFH